MGWTFLPIEQLPEPGDIVWCKFPVRERPGQPGPWVRPVLVTESNIREDPATKIHFGTLVARYGTDYQKIGKKPHYPISTKAEAQAIGLHKPTAFAIDGQSTKHLIWCTEFFVPPNYIRNQGLLIGRLSEAQRQAVSELLAKAR